MFIDPASNRGVRWKPGDPVPDFSLLFNRAGDMLALQPGMPLHWNSRGQLATVTLVERNGSSANDEEFYRYSQGERIYKRHETHTPDAVHFSEVRYMQGLEICTRDNGEELHRINLESAMGNVVCLHWVSGKPPEIADDQLRYTLSDHLGSSVTELDADAQLISAETYLPFGGTASMTARSAVEVDYKTLRYSGKEMDVSGLYDYGARYYAPWLGRWISADPAGDVDGTNLYAFVGNAPLTYVDSMGTVREAAWNLLTSDTPRDRIVRKANFHLTLLKAVSLGVRDIEQQVLNYRSGNHNAAISTAKRTGFFLAEKGASYGLGVGLTAAGVALGIPAGPLGMVIMGAIGFGASQSLSATTKVIGQQTGMSTSISLQPDRLNANKLLKKTSADTGPLVDLKAIQAYNPRKPEGRELLKKQGIETGKDGALALAGKIPYVGPAIKAIPGAIDVIKEVKSLGQELSQEQIDGLDSDITGLINLLEVGSGRLIDQAREMGEPALLGRPLSRIKQKTDKRIGALGDLRTVLHSRSSRFTAV